MHDLPEVTRRFVRSLAWRFNRALSPTHDSLAAFPSEEGAEPAAAPRRRLGGVATIAMLCLLGGAVPIAAGLVWWLAADAASVKAAATIAAPEALASPRAAAPPVRPLLATPTRAPEVPATGQLEIDSEPSGARVSIDGEPVGLAPVSVANLSPGRHTVSIESDRGRIARSVSLEAGRTVSMVVAIPVPAVSAGWISVKSPVAVRIHEGDMLIGSNEIGRILLPSGRHELRFSNEVLGYQAVRSVVVSAGRVSAIALDMPEGTVHLNALPWAEVWVDGRRIGETPIANLMLPIGEHAVVFRHPELGEQRTDIVVGLTTPVRLGVELER